MMSLRILLALALSSSASLVMAQEEVSQKDGVYCLTLHEDLMRRQSDEWGSPGPFTVDDGTKHTPFATFNPDTRKATVIVGNGDATGGVYHPMIASDNPTTVHFVTHIYVLDQNDRLFAVETMDPNMPAPATVVFDVPESVTELTAFEFCNLHGLWKGPTVVTLPPELAANATTNVGKAGVGSEVDNTMVCGIASPLSVAFDSFAADFVRRQSLPPFNSLTPYDEDDGTKHTPYTKINGDGTATITVGVEGNYHVMKPAAFDLDENGDAVEPHWITEVYVVDQTGEILTMESLDPTDVNIAQITLNIPSSATTLTAYEWCNIHGLYVGPTVTVATGEVVLPPQEDEDIFETLSGASRQQQRIAMTAAAAVVGAMML